MERFWLVLSIFFQFTLQIDKAEVYTNTTIFFENLSQLALCAMFAALHLLCICICVKNVKQA